MIKRITLVSLITALLIALGGTVYAQDARTITIIPPKFELFGNPGDQIIESIRVRNDSDFPAVYEIVVEDFSATGEEGQVTLVEEGTENYSLARWLELETKDITLQPREEKGFTFTVNIPRNAEPGGHYASVLFQAGGQSVPGSTAVAQRVGALVLMRVSGNVVENALIETFEAPKYTKTSPFDFTLRLKNEGNTHIRPVGTIVITNIFGKKVDELPLNGQNVMPGTIRKMSTEWNKGNLLGYYTATLVGTYGQQTLPLTAATKVLVVSPTAGILIGVGTLALLLFIVSVISGKSRLLKALKVIITGK